VYRLSQTRLSTTYPQATRSKFPDKVSSGHYRESPLQESDQPVPLINHKNQAIQALRIALKSLRVSAGNKSKITKLRAN